MPGTSTHVNFGRLILAQLNTPYEVFPFVLGTIAPDCFERGDNESFRSYHFVRAGSESDLEYFLEVTRVARQIGDISKQSFIDGYHAHLWLDNFARVHGDALKVANPANLTQDELRALFRANVEQYDLVSIAAFLDTIGEHPWLIEPISGLEFVSREYVMSLFHQLANSVQGVQNRPMQLVVVEQDQYARFLSDAADKFADESSSTLTERTPT